MKCKECKCCKLGWFKSRPEKYVCIGTPEPFVINDIERECTEYAWDSKVCQKKAVYVKQEPYVDDCGIYAPINQYCVDGTTSDYKCVITKEMFIEAYNRWIVGENNETN